MRQTAPRRAPERVAVTTGSNLCVGAGDHVDLGMTVSVYCAGAAKPSLPATGAETAGAARDDTGPCFTEH